MKRVIVFLFAVILTFHLQAQESQEFNGQGQNYSHGDIFDDVFYAPELIMHFSSEIKLTDAQETYIKNEYKKAEAEFTDAHWDLNKEMNKLHGLLKSKKIDEGKVSAQLDRILALEKRIKKQRFSLMIRIKNKLTSEQQAKLDKLRGHGLRLKGGVIAPNPPTLIVTPEGNTKWVSPTNPEHPVTPKNDEH